MTTTDPLHYRGTDITIWSPGQHSIYNFNSEGTPPRWSQGDAVRLANIHNFNRTVEVWYDERSHIVVEPEGRSEEPMKRTGRCVAVVVMENEHVADHQYHAMKAALMVAANYLEEQDTFAGFLMEA